MIFLIVTSILLLGISTYLGYRAWYLAGVLGDIQEQSDEYIKKLEFTNKYMYSQIVQSYENMKRIDHLGAFKSEDEAGTTFHILFETITNLKEEFDVEDQEK
ncbi:MAG: hypothetical protein EBU12_01445 [Microbacteriaceae bacterium]|nr:hypothetical protein [Microbacteriaceae bacterium]